MYLSKEQTSTNNCSVLHHF